MAIPSRPSRRSTVRRSAPPPISRSPATSSWRRARPICRRRSPGSRSCPDAGGTWFLPRIVGPKLALALMLTADQVPAEELHRMGIVYKVFPDCEFIGETMTLARRIAAGPTYTLRLDQGGGARKRRQRSQGAARPRARPAAQGGREPRLLRRHRGVPREAAAALRGTLKHVRGCSGNSRRGS